MGWHPCYLHLSEKQMQYLSVPGNFNGDGDGRAYPYLDRCIDTNIRYTIVYILDVGIKMTWIMSGMTALISPDHLPSFYAALRIIWYALSIIGLPSYVFMKRFSL